MNEYARVTREQHRPHYHDDRRGAWWCPTFATVSDNCQDEGDAGFVDVAGPPDRAPCLHCGIVVRRGVDDDEARTVYWEDSDGFPFCPPDRTTPHQP